MNESLPGTAPSDAAAVPSVEGEAPAADQAVVTESAPGDDEKFVPASRFNGLMGRFNREQNERQALESRLQEALQTIADLQSTPPAKEEPVTDTSHLETQVNQLTQMLMQERLENAKTQALREFPEAQAFADLIVADTPEDVRAMAQVLHERVTARNGGAEPPAPSEESPGGEEPPPTGNPAPGPEPAPVAPGGTTVEEPAGSASFDDRIAEAIRKKDFGSLLQAKYEQKVATEGGELVLQ